MINKGNSVPFFWMSRMLYSFRTVLNRLVNSANNYCSDLPLRQYAVHLFPKWRNKRRFSGTGLVVLSVSHGVVRDLGLFGMLIINTQRVIRRGILQENVLSHYVYFDNQISKSRRTNVAKTDQFGIRLKFVKSGPIHITGQRGSLRLQRESLAKTFVEVLGSNPQFRHPLKSTLSMSLYGRRRRPVGSDRRIYEPLSGVHGVTSVDFQQDLVRQH